MLRARLVRGVLALLSLALAAGCATTVSGHGIASVAPSTSTSTSTSTSPDFPTAPPSTTPPTPTAPTSSPPPSPASRDITDVKWRTPRGFVRSHAYQPVTPLERHWQAAYLVPRNERRGRDVIGIYLYRLPSGVALNSIDAQKSRVRYYNDRTSTRVQGGLTVERLKGRPAIFELGIQQRTYTYSAWFVFSQRHLVELECQWDQQTGKISYACGIVLASLTLS